MKNRRNQQKAEPRFNTGFCFSLNMNMCNIS